MKFRINFHFLYVFIAASLWGAAGIFVRALNQSGIFEMQIVFGRAFFTSVVLGLFILIKDIKLFKIKPKDLWLFVCGGLFSIVLFNYSYYTTMALTKSLAVAAVLLYTAPFFVLIISLFLFGEKLNINKVLACFIAFLGCCFVSGLFGSSYKISGVALVFGLLTGFGYALYTVFGELLIKRGYNSLTITFYVFTAAMIGCIPFINIKNTVTVYLKDQSSLITIILMAVTNTVIPYLLYTVGLKGVEPSTAPIIATVEPVVATLVGAFYFKDDIPFLGYVGIVLVILSVVVLNLKNKKIVKMRANAKINLTLGITGKREDGYHLIDTVMQSVDLYDTVTVSMADKITVDCGVAELKNENNIAFSAAKLFFEKIAAEGGAEIKIEKNIPAAAGLGGGSADAAAVLLALDKLYNTNLSYETLCEIALKLGADVPFFIKGGTQRAEGIGEILTSLPSLKQGYFVLIKQGNKPSTGEMYRRLDSENHPIPDVEKTVRAIENCDISALAESLGNSFTAVNEPFELKQYLLDSGALAVSLSGSGPTNFALFGNKTKAQSVYNALKAQNVECYIVNPIEKGIVFE